MKTIKLIMLTLMLASVSAYAADGIRFAENKTWKQLLAQAKKENKLIFLDAYASWCGPCNYMQNNVFTQTQVAGYFNSTFINAAFDMEKGEGVKLAEEYGVTAYPTLFFINGDGKLVHKYVGAVEPDEFIMLGHDAANPGRQYFTLKDKAKAGNLLPEDFLNWVKMAERMEDDDKREMVHKYLDNPALSWKNKDVLNLALNYAEDLPSTRITYLLQHKADIINITGISTDEYQQSIQNIVTNRALHESMQGNVLNFDVFTRTIKMYMPEKAALETQKMKVKYAFYQEDYTKALNELAVCIDNSDLNLDALTLATYMFERGEIIAKEKKTDWFAAKVASFKLNADDREKGYFKEFALLSLYYYGLNKSKASEKNDSIQFNENAPEYLTTLAAKMISKWDDR